MMQSPVGCSPHAREAEGRSMRLGAEAGRTVQGGSLQGLGAPETARALSHEQRGKGFEGCKLESDMIRPMF